MTSQEGSGAQVRELLTGTTALAYDAMVELRPHLESVDEFVARVDELQRPEGYRLVGAFVTDGAPAVAVAGFRFVNNLVSGHVLYVDDLVTAEAHRSKGYAGSLMDWLIREAVVQGCEQLQLDSATHRHAAHRFYLGKRLNITAFHFGVNVSGSDAD